MLKSGYCEGETPSEPTPDVYTQMMNSMKEPYVGDNGNWYVWDVESKSYRDTEVRAQGPEGPQGPPGKGEPGLDGFSPILEVVPSENSNMYRMVKNDRDM